MSVNQEQSSPQYTSPHHKVRLIDSGDDDPAMNRVLSEIRDLKCHFVSKLDEMKDKLIRDIDIKIDCMKDEFNKKFDILESKVNKIDSRVQVIETKDHKMDLSVNNPEITVIVRGLCEEPREDLPTKV